MYSAIRGSFDDAVARDEHIGRLQIAVDDAACVRGRKPRGELQRDVHEAAP
jgi:hypothetical protein